MNRLEHCPENSRKQEEPMVEVGEKAGAFCMNSSTEEKICLKDLRGKWVVLFFYVKDGTSG